MNKYAYLMLGLIGGIALGFNFGRAYGIRTGSQMAETNQHVQMGQQVEVVVAAEDILAGTVLQPRLLGKMRVFSSAVRNAVPPEEAKLILGRKTLFSIKARQPIMWADIEGGTIKSNQPPPAN